MFVPEHHGFRPAAPDSTRGYSPAPLRGEWMLCRKCHAPPSGGAHSGGPLCHIFAHSGGPLCHTFVTSGSAGHGDRSQPAGTRPRASTMVPAVVSSNSSTTIPQVDTVGIQAPFAHTSAHDKFGPKNLPPSA